MVAYVLNVQLKLDSSDATCFNFLFFFLIGKHENKAYQARWGISTFHYNQTLSIEVKIFSMVGNKLNAYK
uniref:Uncharacterized protein n=1 Tax=Rhizophora mucronata TaxID=61149 RepID=A0A2P2NDS2_RHIMU